MDINAIKQSAMDMNNVAETSLQSGKEHFERPLLAKIEELQAENKRYKKALKRLLGTESRALDYVEGLRKP